MARTVWKTGICIAFGLAAGAAGLVRAAEEPAARPEPVLKHAVICPPFKGDPDLAARYHAELVALLKAEPGIEYLEGPRAAGRKAQEFSYRINGAIVADEAGRPFVMVALVDEARKERIASHVAPASADPQALAAWKRTIQADTARRAAHLPFECRIRQQLGQESVSLDRGLGSGLQPGMVLYVSVDEEPLISPVTGETVGRDSPRAAGQIQVFRLVENAAYARPVAGTELPRFAKLYARSF